MKTFKLRLMRHSIDSPIYMKEAYQVVQEHSAAAIELRMFMAAKAGYSSIVSTFADGHRQAFEAFLFTPRGSVEVAMMTRAGDGQAVLILLLAAITLMAVQDTKQACLHLKSCLEAFIERQAMDHELHTPVLQCRACPRLQLVYTV